MEPVNINHAPVAPPGMLRHLLPIFLIVESTIQDFEARTRIKVVYDVYDASEVLETKLLTGSSGYDVGRGGARMPSASQPVPHERWHD